MQKPKPERLQKVLAQAGFGSRREIETWISAGRISINDKTATLGEKASIQDRIKLDGRDLKLKHSTPTQTKVLAYYKPEGEVTSNSDEKGRRTVFKSIPKAKQGKWINIGRLDINTSGLLLFTNNGELANKLMHPSTMIEREYAVRVLGTAKPEQLNRLREGVKLEDGLAKFTDIVDSGGAGSNHWYHVVIMEGKNREVRRLWESVGLKVSRLMRVRYGSYLLPQRKRPGQFWDLDKDEINTLIQDTSLK
jgi:23S rRNA pseudouridine2605 synthase